MWRKGQKRSRGKRTTMMRLSREPHWELQGSRRQKCMAQLPKRASRFVCSQLPLESTVQESNKGGNVVFVDVLMGVCMGDIPISLTDEFRIFWGIKNPNFSSCLYISLRDSTMSENPRELRIWSGNTSSSLLILTAPSPTEMCSSAWKCQLASPTGAWGSRKLSPLCGSHWLLHLFAFCHQTCLFKQLEHISQWHLFAELQKVGDDNPSAVFSSSGF